MGLLDSLNSPGGYGGLLDMLMYKSPLLQQQEAVPGPQYDPTGMPFAGAPQGDTSPFGPLPQMNQPTPAMYQKPSPFNNGGAAPIPNFQPNAAIAPQAAIAQPAQPENQVNDINVGGYQMPRFGSAQDFTPQGGPTDVSAQSRQPQQIEQPQQAPQAQQALPPAFGGGSVLGRIGSPDGLIAKLTGNDTRSIAQQNLKAQYDALVPLVGQQKAMLAVMNPEAGKTILAQAFEKKQFGFMKTDGDQVIATDPTNGTAKVAYGGDTKTGTLAGPDGKPIAIPEGLDASARKIFVNEIARINADAAAGKKTGEQATAEIFANKMELSNKTLDTLANQGTSLAGKLASGLPMGNYIQSAEYQKYKQAASNFITSLLRKESGAAIGKDEFTRYEKEYMPQPGDGPEVLAQKTEARRVAIDAMKKGAGPGYKSPSASPLPSGWSVSVR